MPWNVVSRLGLQDDAFGRPDKGLALRQALGNALDAEAARRATQNGHTYSKGSSPCHRPDTRS
jgi:hypothetical protein